MATAMPVFVLEPADNNEGKRERDRKKERKKDVSTFVSSILKNGNAEEKRKEKETIETDERLKPMGESFGGGGVK